MASEIKVDKISPYSGSAINLGASGQKIQVPAGVTVTNSGTATGFAGGKVLQTKSVTVQGRKTISATGTSWTELSGSSITLTAASTSNRLLFLCSYTGTENGTSWHCRYYNKTTSAIPTNGVHPGEGSRPGCTTKHNSNNASWASSIPMFTFVTPPNTSANEYCLQGAAHSGPGYANSNHNNNNAANADDCRTQITFTIMEVSSSIV